MLTHFRFMLLGDGAVKESVIEPAARQGTSPGKLVMVFLALLAALIAPAADWAMPGGKSYKLAVPGNTAWTDTKVDVLPGEKLKITAEGTVTFSIGLSAGPEGQARGWMDLLHQYPVPNAGHGALIGRIGNGDGSQPFLVGASYVLEAQVGGRLFLGINEGTSEATGTTGKFQVRIEVQTPGSASKSALTSLPPETAVPGITQQLLGKIPRRVSDKAGNAGDMVNVLVIGSQQQLLAALQAGGWVQVDRSVEDTILHGLEETLSKQVYLTMPMSTLYLFDRPQDYGFAHAEPVRVVETRNHMRAWKSPYTVGGRQLWCIAATHDIGFERDDRNNGITHKIDPNVDGEREYINDTLSATGLVTARSHVTPLSPLTEAKTATGGSFHSDGRILVLVLQDAPQAAQPAP